VNTLYDYFRHQVTRAPNRIALVFKDESITYAVLDEQGSRFARRLRARGVGPGSLVAVDMRHSPALIVTLLAIADTGAAYVGIDPAWPASRAREVLQHSKPQALVVDERDDGLGFDGDALVFSADEATAEPPRLPTPATGGDLFGVAYTSGTTGKPKGVLITVGSVLNRLEWMWRTYPFQSGDVAFVYRSSTTVGFAWDCFGALLQGFPTVISPVEDVRDAAAVARAAGHAGVTYCSGSVGFWGGVLDQATRTPDFWPALRVARCSGEPLPPAMVGRWRRAFPSARLLNIYGATECSGSTAFDTSAFDPTGTPRVPVGRPIPGVELLVVDDDMRPLSEGEVGNVCVGGASLARGYLNDPQLTTERFVPHPARPAEARVFRTGDIGFWRSDGHLEVTGRRDLQVKIRGYRVEIEEVEAALGRCPGVRAAAVHVEPDGDSRRLIALVVPESPSAPHVSPMRRALADMLPAYMIPSEFVAVGELPRTASGKVDRTALACQPRIAIEESAAPVLLRTPTEERVAAAWREVLGLAEIGRDDGFFEIGGHSLSAMQIVWRLQDAFGIDVPLRLLFAHPSIGRLAAEIDSLLCHVRQGEQVSPRRAAGEAEWLS
jgi:amino acid adenylation domain-containing protein